MNLLMIQARMNSTRLPGKVMLDLLGKSVLENIIDRLSYCKRCNDIIVLTSIDSSNDPIREFGVKKNIKVFSGSESDVLDRFYMAGNSLELDECDNIIRITADCPLIDPTIIDKVIELHESSNSDYTSNVIEPTFPDGLDCEIFKFNILRAAWNQSKLMSEREHVTLFIRNNPSLFKLTNFRNNSNLSHLRWTLDEELDFHLIKSIYHALIKKNEIFLMDDILEYLRNHPELININKHINRNEGLEKSIKSDLAMGKKI